MSLIGLFTGERPVNDFSGRMRCQFITAPGCLSSLYQRTTAERVKKQILDEVKVEM